MADKPHSASAQANLPLLSRKGTGNNRGGLANWLDRYFRVSLRGSTLATEVRAGTTAFLATSNNFVVNAQIMSHMGVNSQEQIVSGAFAAGITCILSGVLSNLPLGLVPSVGPNVFLAYSLVGPGLFTISEALAISASCGGLIVLLSVTPALKVILGLMPLSIKYGLLVGTGLLTAFIGLKSIGIVVPDTHGADIVALGDLMTLPVAVSTISLVATASMLYNAVNGAVLVGMLTATVAFWICSGDYPTQFVSLQALTSFHLDFGALGRSQAWTEIGALMLMLLFSLSGAVIGGARMAGLLGEDGRVRGSTAVFICSGLGTILSAKLGTAPIFVSMSAAAGIRDGGRTGLVSVVIGVYAIITAFFLSPLASAIPHCAVSPVLVLVGVSMTGEATEIQWWNILDALPAFLCAVFQPFTYSVSNGIYAGCGMSLVLFFTTGTFISYFPCLRRAEKEVAADEEEEMEVTKQSLQDVCAALQEEEEESPVAVRKRFRRTNTMSASTAKKLVKEQSAQFEEEQEQGMVRGQLTRLGAAAREEAIALVEKAAQLIGLDPEQTKEMVFERLEASRKAESHNLGGIPGCESYRAEQEMSKLLGVRAPQPAQLASLVRLRRSHARNLVGNTPGQKSDFSGGSSSRAPKS